MIEFVRYCFGWGWLGRWVNNEVGIVAKVTEGFAQKAEVAVPEKLFRADSKVGVEEDFQAVSLERKGGMTEGA